MKTVLSRKGQVVRPVELRQRDSLLPGQRLNDGLVDWLLACPEKGWFRLIDSESTDVL